MRNLLPFNGTQCIWWIVFCRNGSGSNPIIVQGNILLSNLSFLHWQELPRIQCDHVVLFPGKYSLEFKVNNTSPSITLQKVRECMPVSDFNHRHYLFIVVLRQSVLHKSHAVIVDYCLSVPTVVNLLRPRGIFMCLTFFTLQNINTS